MQTTNQYVSNRVHPNFFEKIDGFRNHLALVNPEKTEILLKKAIIFIRSLQKQKKLYYLLITTQNYLFWSNLQVKNSNNTIQTKIGSQVY